jgi:hypothetical protein
MKSSIIYLVFVFCILPFTSFAQFEVLRDVANPGAPLRANPYREVKGSAYLSDFSPGSIIYTKTDTLKNIPIRFNAYGNMLEYQNKGSVFGLSAKDILGFVTFSDGRPLYFSDGYDLPNLGKDIFVQVLVQGNYTLLNYRHKTLIDDPSVSYGSQRAKAFQDKNDYYVFHNGKVTPFVPKKKNLSENFGDVWNQINEMDGLNNLNLRLEEDIIKLITLFNSL